MLTLLLDAQFNWLSVHVKTYLALHGGAFSPFKSAWAQNRKSTYLLRDGQSGKLTVDDYGAKTGRSPGKMRQLNINGPLYIGTWGSLLSQPLPPLPQHHLHSNTYCKWSWLNHIITMTQQSAVSCPGRGWMSSQPLYLSPWRRHEGNLPAHQQAVQRRPGGLRVPFHPLHRLPLSAGGGRRRRQKHQHMLQLEKGQSSAGGKSWTCRYNQRKRKRQDLLVLAFRAIRVETGTIKSTNAVRKQLSVVPKDLSFRGGDSNPVFI